MKRWTKANGERNAGPARLVKYTGNSQRDQERIDGGSMAENSKPSAQKGKRHTTPTESESESEPQPGDAPTEALEILEAALHICEKAGLPVFLTPIHEAGQEYTGILVKQTRLEGRRIRYTGNSYTGNPPAYTGNPAKPAETTGNPAEGATA